MSEIISNLKLPQSWRQMVNELLTSKDDVIEANRERARLEEKLRRLRRLYQEVAIEESEYPQEVASTKARLVGLVDTGQDEVVTLGDNVEGIVEAWDLATKEERRDMLQMMLNAVYIDMPTKQIVGLEPKAAFLPLFQLEEPIKSGEVVLSTDLTAAAVNSTPSPHPRHQVESTNPVFNRYV